MIAWVELAAWIELSASVFCGAAGGLNGAGEGFDRVAEALDMDMDIDGAVDILGGTLVGSDVFTFFAVSQILSMVE